MTHSRTGLTISIRLWCSRTLLAAVKIGITDSATRLGYRSIVDPEGAGSGDPARAATRHRRMTRVVEGLLSNWMGVRNLEQIEPWTVGIKKTQISAVFKSFDF